MLRLLLYLRGVLLLYAVLRSALLRLQLRSLPLNHGHLFGEVLPVLRHALLLLLHAFMLNGRGRRHRMSRLLTARSLAAIPLRLQRRKRRDHHQC